MAGTNDFLSFAGGAGANVLSQSAYAALTTLLANGFSAGVAESAQLNKVWRQSSLMAAMVGDFIAEASGQNVVDDGTTVTILLNLLKALDKRNVGLDGSAAANAYTLTLAPAPTALTPGMVVTLQNILNTSTGTATLNVNGTGALPIYKNGAPLAGGELILGDDVRLQLNEAGTAWNLLFTTTGLFAAINGSASQAFKVADAVNANEAVALGQSLLASTGASSARTAGTTYTNSKPYPVQVFAMGDTGGSANLSPLITVSVQGNTVFRNGGVSNYNEIFISFTVPPGGNYLITAQNGSSILQYNEVS